MNLVIKDITGKRSGMLVAIKPITIDERIKLGLTPGRGAYWHCACDCGKKKIIRGPVISGGKSYSCGCTRRPPRMSKYGIRAGFILNTPITQRPESTWSDCNYPL